ncbi:MAG TPA: CshA/CshB family fibrillar adhesin-related protein, partial [Ramlibacter sp.]|nr:CshA/CshB family fibrillar adhesin-related protein [Ramlibacter sp.]
MSAHAGFPWRWLAAAALGLLLSIGGPGVAQAQTDSTCAAAATRGTAPTDFRDYCWLSFTNYNDTAARSGGQNYRFSLPDGTVITMRLEVDSFTGASGTRLAAVAVPSWSGSAFGNTAFIGIPGTPVLYNAQNATSVRVRLRNIQVTPPTGGVASYSIIAADGESSNDGESLQFITNGNDWTRVASIQNGTSTTFPGESFAGTNTVTLTGVAGTVGSYVYRSDGQPSEVSATVAGGGLQGVIFGVRYASVAAVSQINTSRYYPADQFTYSLRTGAGSTLVSGSTTGAGLNGFTPAVMPTVAASYPFHVVQGMAPGSTGTLANYTTTLTCVNANASSGTPMPVNQPISPGSPSYVFNNLQYRDSVLCTFTNTPIFSSVGGTVYSDANRNGSQDGGEAGVSAAGLFVKLAPVSGGVCTGPAHQAVAVAAGTGAFNVTNVPQGEYCLILDTNNTLSDITPTLPAGWIGIQNGGGTVRASIPAGTTPESPQSFGLFNGSRLAGSVFADTGTGAGVANDGTRQGGEAGFAGLTVRASSGATTIATATTSGDGSFELWLPATAAAVTVGPA